MKQFNEKTTFREEHHRSLKEASENELERLISSEWDAIIDINKKRTEKAKSLKKLIVNTAGAIGTAIGVGTAVAAVVTTGPLSVPAFIAGSRLLATATIFGSGIFGGITTAANVGGAIVNRLPWLNRRRITQQKYY